MSSSRDPSRRDFLAASAFGLLGLARGSEAPSLRDDEMQSDGHLLYVGTYTEGTGSEGVYLLRMDRSAGKLQRIGAVDAGANPSFLTIHPNGQVLYAVNELDNYNGRATGAVSAFAIARSGSLTRLHVQPSEGSAPCYISVDHPGRAVLVANYNGGNLAVFPIKLDGALSPASQVVQHVGKGPNADRQEKAHAHCVVADPSNRFVLAADLGADRVFVYRRDAGAQSLQHVAGGDAIMRPGSGPRHIAFHPTLPLVFVANELDSTVATLRFDQARGALSLLDTRSTLPSKLSGANYPADIHLAPSGRTLYVSNRGHNSIAVFSVTEAGALALEQVISTEGDWPRNFTLDLTGRWLVVANQRSNSIIVFARNQQNGKLTPTKQRIEIPSPVCLRFPPQLSK